ncbi:hypothetical protein HDV06_004179 [Boothiomyces sp. JEL0866]|nr:hypothetical protein HDV06_004179 [Boothiomyces sp. JEL0866]
MASNAFTIGIGFDGVPETGLDYSSPITMIAVVIVSMYLLLAIGMLVRISMGWLKISRTSKVFCFSVFVNVLVIVYYIVLLVRYSNVTFPFLIWLFSILGVVGLYVVIMGQLDILKVFTVNSKILTVKRINACQVVFTIWNIISMGGLYLSVGSLGSDRPNWMKMWDKYGYILFCISCIAYETWHAIFVAKAVVDQARIRRKLIKKAATAADAEEFSVFKTLYYFVIICVAIDWTAGLIWVSSWFLKSEYANAVSVIGSTIGMGHIIFLIMIFKAIKSVNVEKVTSKNMKSVDSKSAFIRRKSDGDMIASPIEKRNIKSTDTLASSGKLNK